jgi:hypothetical protein
MHINGIHHLAVWDTTHKAYVRVSVDVFIDVDRIVKRLATKAHNGKSGRAVAMGGDVIVKLVKAKARKDA